MKITLVILSVLILLAAGYAAWWLMFQASYIGETIGYDDNGLHKYIGLAPQHEVLTVLARGAAAVVFLLAILLLVFSFSRKHAISSIIISACVAAFSAFISIFGLPQELVSKTPVKGDQILHVLYNPAAPEVLAQRLAAAAAVLGLTVLILHIYKLIKVRKLVKA